MKILRVEREGSLSVSQASQDWRDWRPKIFIRLLIFFPLAEVFDRVEL